MRNLETAKEEWRNHRARTDESKSLSTASKAIKANRLPSNPRDTSEQGENDMLQYDSSIEDDVSKTGSNDLDEGLQANPQTTTHVCDLVVDVEASPVLQFEQYYQEQGESAFLEKVAQDENFTKLALEGLWEEKNQFILTRAFKNKFSHSVSKIPFVERLLAALLHDSSVSWLLRQKPEDIVKFFKVADINKINFQSLKDIDVEHIMLNITKIVCDSSCLLWKKSELISCTILRYMDFVINESKDATTASHVQCLEKLKKCVVEIVGRLSRTDDGLLSIKKTFDIYCQTFGHKDFIDAITDYPNVGYFLFETKLLSYSDVVKFLTANPEFANNIVSGLATNTIYRLSDIRQFNLLYPLLCEYAVISALAEEVYKSSIAFLLKHWRHKLSVEEILRFEKLSEPSAHTSKEALEFYEGEKENYFDETPSHFLDSYLLEGWLQERGILLNLLRHGQQIVVISNKVSLNEFIDQLQKHWKKLATKYHPDKNKPDDRAICEFIFNQIKKAIDTFKKYTEKTDLKMHEDSAFVSLMQEINLYLETLRHERDIIKQKAKTDEKIHNLAYEEIKNYNDLEEDIIQEATQSLDGFNDSSDSETDENKQLARMQPHQKVKIKREVGNGLNTLPAYKEFKKKHSKSMSQLNKEKNNYQSKFD